MYLNWQQGLLRAAPGIAALAPRSSKPCKTQATRVERMWNSLWPDVLPAETRGLQAKSP